MQGVLPAKALLALLLTAACVLPDREAAAQSPGAETAARWQTVLDGGAQYYSWTNSTGGSGSQIYIPAAAKWTGRPHADLKAEFLVRSGYMWTRQSASTSTTSARSMTDTAVGTTWTYYGINGVQPFLAMNVNVPTARWTTVGSASAALPTNKTDSDIIKSPILGEGWNLSPSVGANFPVNESTILSAGFGYTYRGPFTGATTTGLTSTGLVRFNPGDVYTVNGGLGWQGERDVVQLAVAYSLETTSTQDNVALYRAGRRIIVNLKGGHTWDDNWATRAAFTYSHFGKNDVPATAVPDLVREAFNSNSDVYRVSLDHIYSKDNYSIGPTGTFLYRDRNGYDPLTFQFIPAKTSWSAGLAAQVAPTQNSSLSVRAEHIWVNEGDNPDKLSVLNTILSGSGVAPAITRAWAVSVGGNIKL